jgi:hypothetical protein
MKTRMRFAVLSLVLGALPAVQTTGQTTSVDTGIESLEQRLELARAAHLHLIAPGNLEKAAETPSDAKDEFESGGKIEDFRRRLRESQKALDNAEAFQEVGNILMEDALVAWSDALVANAPEHAADEWKEAKEAMYEAGREIEDGDHGGARDGAAKAREALRVAEFEAIPANLLGKAKERRAEALSLDADDRVTITLESAESLLRQAEQVLQGDRYQRGEASALASQAAAQFRHAANIARTQAQVDRNTTVEVERLVLEHEQLLLRVANGPAIREGTSGACR